MAEALLKAIPLDIAALGVYLCSTDLILRWNVVPKWTSEHAVDVDLE
jgi:hypothetical protein